MRIYVNFWFVTYGIELQNVGMHVSHFTASIDQQPVANCNEYDPHC